MRLPTPIILNAYHGIWYISTALQVVVLDDDSFERRTQGSTDADWFVKFYASWCGHCKMLVGSSLVFRSMFLFDVWTLLVAQFGEKRA